MEEIEFKRIILVFYDHNYADHVDRVYHLFRGMSHRV
jgi:hypothetical protein